MIFIASALHQLLLGTSPSAVPWLSTGDEKMAVTRPPTGASSIPPLASHPKVISLVHFLSGKIKLKFK